MKSREVKPTPALRDICYLAGITITSDELTKITELAIGKEADSDIEIVDKEVEEFILIQKELIH